MSKYSENIPPSIIGAIGWFYDDIPEGSTVLDVGCSTGYYGEYIKNNKKSSVYGIEVSDDKKEAIKVLDGVYSFDLDAEWPEEINERKYDVIFFGDVIEHLKDPGKALKRAGELLNKGGRVFVSTPNVAHMSIRLELLGGNFEYESMGILDSTHLKYFTLHSLTKLVTNAGYKIDRIDYSISDYPEEVVQGILDKYGLSASSQFWKMLEDPTARAFQYKFVLSLGQKLDTPATVPLPDTKPEQYKKDFIKNMQIELESTKKAYETQSKEMKKISEALSSIVDSKTYKLAQKMQKVKQTIRK